MGEWVSGKTTTRGQGEEKKNKKRVQQQQQQEEGAGEPGLVFCRMLGEEVGARGRRLGWPAGDKSVDKWVPGECLGVQGDSRHCSAKPHLCASVSV